MQIGKSLANVRALVPKTRTRKLPAIVASIFVIATMVMTAFVWSSPYVPSFSSVQKSHQPSDIWILDRNGVPLESIRTLNERRSLGWVRWSEVSPSFQELLIKVEDQRYFSHPGFDFLAAAKAAWERLAGTSVRGASTLTMQTVGLLEQTSKGRRRSFSQKATQIAMALKLDWSWRKDEVLEAYINLVAFRGELVGLKAASLGYFSKNPSGLLREESALLVALLRSPNSSPDLVAKRACAALESSDCTAVRTLAHDVLSKPYRLARSRELVPVFSRRFVMDDSNPSVFQTSLDYRTQDLAIRTLREQLDSLKNQNVNDGAVLVLETKTGRVVAYVANAGSDFASAVQIDGIQSRRQAGSTLKPFVYATAFEWQFLNPGSLLEDSPADIPVAQGRVYRPKNYDHVFRGLVSASDALGSSMNVPAVRSLQLAGESRVLDKLRAVGFENLLSADHYGPSLALGTVDVTLWELTQGYRQFALDDSPFSHSTRASIFNILASSEHRRFTFGMDSLLTLPFPAAVKTGTSKDMRDNWCIGWTPDYTVGVWVGNFNGDPMWNVSGMSGAAPVWRSLMLALHTQPQGTSTTYVPSAEPLPTRTLTRIKYPAQDMLVGLDPDIPARLQKLPIEIENPQSGHKVFLNSRLLSEARETTMWSIQRGKYLVELKSPDNQIIDSLNFEVR